MSSTGTLAPRASSDNLISSWRRGSKFVFVLQPRCRYCNGSTACGGRTEEVQGRTGGARHPPGTGCFIGSPGSVALARRSLQMLDARAFMISTLRSSGQLSQAGFAAAVAGRGGRWSGNPVNISKSISKHTAYNYPIPRRVVCPSHRR